MRDDVIYVVTFYAGSLQRKASRRVEVISRSLISFTILPRRCRQAARNMPSVLLISMGFSFRHFIILMLSLSFGLWLFRRRQRESISRIVVSPAGSHYGHLSHMMMTHALHFLFMMYFHISRNVIFFVMGGGDVEDFTDIPLTLSLMLYLSSFQAPILFYFLYASFFEYQSSMIGITYSLCRKF